jgi:RNA polymerase-binding protein DksA
MAAARLDLRVAPGAARTEIAGRHGSAWKIRVSAPPERGRANEAVIALLADVLGVPRKRLTVVAGAAARDKVIEVDGMSREEADRLLAGGRRKGGCVNVQRFRELLVEERKRVTDAIEYLHHENAGSQDEEAPETGLADTATVTVDREVDYSLEEHSAHVLQEIDAALARIDDGTFGICSRCGAPIGEERLEAMPHATLCIECKRREERG